MIADFFRRLTAPQTESLAPDDARLALSALLVRVARTDGDYAADEITRIDRILAARYGLDATGARALRAEAEAVEAEAPDTVRFTSAIRDAVAYEDRVAVIEALWQVALADGQRDADEDAILRLVTRFLGVNDRDSALVRQRVAAG